MLFRSWDIPSRGKRILAWKKVVFHNEPVAVVAAVTPTAAEEALALITVQYEALPIVLDPEVSMKPGATLLHDGVFTETFNGKAQTPSNVAKVTEMAKGDVDHALTHAPVRVNASFRTAMVHQGYIEPQACLAEYAPDGRFSIWTSTQGSFGVRSGLAGFMKVPPRRVRVTASEVGGGFGAKGAMSLEPICAVLAFVTGRPVMTIVAVCAVLLVCVLGVLSNPSGLGIGGGFRDKPESIQGQVALSRALPAGELAATQVVVRAPASLSARPLRTLILLMTDAVVSFPPEEVAQRYTK